MLFVVAMLLVDRSVSQPCPLPGMAKIKELLQQALDSQVGEGVDITATLHDYHFTCLTVEARDLYRSLSVAVNYTTISSTSSSTSHLLLRCSVGSFQRQTPVDLELNAPASALSVTTRRDCLRCSTVSARDPQTNCVGEEFLYSASL